MTDQKVESKINCRPIQNHLSTITDCVDAIMAAEKLLSDIIYQAEGKGVNGFIAGGLCKTIKIAIGEVAYSKDCIVDIIDEEILSQSDSKGGAHG